MPVVESQRRARSALLGIGNDERDPIESPIASARTFGAEIHGVVLVSVVMDDRINWRVAIAEIGARNVAQLVQYAFENGLLAIGRSAKER